MFRMNARAVRGRAKASFKKIQPLFSLAGKLFTFLPAAEDYFTIAWAF